MITQNHKLNVLHGHFSPFFGMDSHWTNKRVTSSQQITPQITLVYYKLSDVHY